MLIMNKMYIYNAYNITIETVIVLKINSNNSKNSIHLSNSPWT